MGTSTEPPLSAARPAPMAPGATLRAPSSRSPHRAPIRFCTASPAGLTVPRVSTPENRQILELYVNRFNSRDWDGLRELISADARLLVADRYSGSLAAGGYLGVYSRMRPGPRVARTGE